MEQVLLGRGDVEVVGARVVIVLVVGKVTMGRGGTGRFKVQAGYHACSSHIMVQNQLELELTRGSP
jgi:hypothetical protein